MGFQNEMNEYEAIDYTKPKLRNKQNLLEKQSFTTNTNGKPAYRNPTTTLWMYFTRPVKVENDTTYFEIKNETQSLLIAFNDYQIPVSNTSFEKHTIVYTQEINLFQPSLFTNN